MIGGAYSLYVTCDAPKGERFCGSHTLFTGRNEEEAADRARQAGWQVWWGVLRMRGRGIATCPACGVIGVAALASAIADTWRRVADHLGTMVPSDPALPADPPSE